ncbi:hypothetical protein DCCM_4279 [Desulfocucumis palustris]|uniref:Uncharacterized protein n=1 Tax=Desulfocucumis palustris TaxID=1898651 RepID=A0A2L2XLI5_9FIRM|nr:hypothetical protein DCCM_4279 [Desulfocucumis palustris]
MFLCKIREIFILRMNCDTGARQPRAKTGRGYAAGFFRPGRLREGYWFFT